MDMGDIKGYILAGGHIKALPHTFSVFSHHFFDPDQNASSLVCFFCIAIYTGVPEFKPKKKKKKCVQRLFNHWKRQSGGDNVIKYRKIC